MNDGSARHGDFDHKRVSVPSHVAPNDIERLGRVINRCRCIPPQRISGRASVRSTRPGSGPCRKESGIVVKLSVYALRSPYGSKRNTGGWFAGRYPGGDHLSQHVARGFHDMSTTVLIVRRRSRPAPARLKRWCVASVTRSETVAESGEDGLVRASTARTASRHRPPDPGSDDARRTRRHGRHGARCADREMRHVPVIVQTVATAPSKRRRSTPCGPAALDFVVKPVGAERLAGVHQERACDSMQLEDEVRRMRRRVAGVAHVQATSCPREKRRHGHA